MNITNFDRQNLKSLRNEIQAALDLIAKNNGLSNISMGNGRFDSESFSCKITANTRSIGVPSAFVNTPSVPTGMFGLPSDIIGRTFTQNRTVFTVKELKPSRPKFPIICTTQNGARYKFTVESIKRHLGIN